MSRCSTTTASPHGGFTLKATTTSSEWAFHQINCVKQKGNTDNVYRNHHCRHRSDRRLHLAGSRPRRGQPAAASAASAAPRQPAAFAADPCCTARAARARL